MYEITTATLDDLDYILDLAKKEGWNPGLYDARPFFACDPKGFFIGKLNGKKIGCISGVAYNDEFGFIGLYIIEKEYRGQGYGLALWNRAISYLGPRTMGLDGVIEQQNNYKKSGFHFYYRNIRYEGTGKQFPQTDLLPIQDGAFEKIVSYDSSIFGLSRERFLLFWLNRDQTHGFVKMEQDKILGYGLARKCVKGYKIGPLFADTYETASQIYEALSSKVIGQALILDVPEINEMGIRLAKEYHHQMVFETARMYNKPPPEQQIYKLFGVTTLEIG